MSLFHRKPMVGRKLTCSQCAHRTVKGTMRVLRSVVFVFCPDCWIDKHEACEAQMCSVAGVRQKAAA